MDSLTERLHKIQSQYFPRWNINHQYRIKKWDLSGASDPMFDTPTARHDMSVRTSNENRQVVLTDFLTNF